MPRNQKKGIIVPAELNDFILLDYLTVLVKSQTRVTFKELKSFCYFYGIELTPFESETLILMSDSYFNFLSHAFHPSCLNPIIEKEEKEEVIKEKMVTIKNHMQMIKEAQRKRKNRYG